MTMPLLSSTVATEEFFGFSRRPFRGTPAADDFVSVPTLDQEIERLRVAASQGDGLAVLTAAPGAGKTAACLRLEEVLRATFTAVVLSSSGFATRRALLQAILFSLGQSYDGLTEQELRLSILNHARGTIADRDGIVLIIDEAHLLNARQLEELRCLTNHSEAGRPLIRVVLCGQLPLEDALVSPALEALNYRITCHSTLDPLSMQESAELVAGRLHHAGAAVEDVLTTDALETICRVSDGSPRCLVHLCDQSLTLAAAAGEVPVAVQTVRAALHELKQLPLQWNESAVDRGDSIAESSVDAATSAGIDEFGSGPAIEAAAADHHEDSIDTVETPEPWSNEIASVEVGSSPSAQAAEEFPHWSSFEPGTDDAEAESMTLSEQASVAVVETGTAAERSLPHDASEADGFVEWPVDDRYAALDGRAARTDNIENRSEIDQALVSSVPSPRTCGSQEPEVSRGADPVERLDEVIAALSVMTDESADHRNETAGGRGNQWRSTGESRRFDVVEPPDSSEQSLDDRELTGSVPGADSESDMGNHSGAQPQMPPRPYARLFSRVRRERIGGGRHTS